MPAAPASPSSRSRRIAATTRSCSTSRCSSPARAWPSPPCRARRDGTAPAARGRLVAQALRHGAHRVRPAERGGDLAVAGLPCGTCKARQTSAWKAVPRSSSGRSGCTPGWVMNRTIRSAQPVSVLSPAQSGPREAAAELGFERSALIAKRRHADAAPDDGLAKRGRHRREADCLAAPAVPPRAGVMPRPPGAA